MNIFTALTQASKIHEFARKRKAAVEGDAELVAKFEAARYRACQLQLALQDALDAMDRDAPDVELVTDAEAQAIVDKAKAEGRHVGGFTVSV